MLATLKPLDSTVGVTDAEDLTKEGMMSIKISRVAKELRTFILKFLDNTPASVKLEKI